MGKTWVMKSARALKEDLVRLLFVVGVRQIE